MDEISKCFAAIWKPSVYKNLDIANFQRKYSLWCFLRDIEKQRWIV